MKKFLYGFLLLLCTACLALCVSASGAETVYLDGTVTASGDGLSAATAVKTLEEAATAVADGGTIIVSGNTTTPTKLYAFPEKDITVTAASGAVLTLGRVLVANGDLTFENITIANGTSANADFIYANGHNLTIGEGVTTVASTSTKRYISLAAGINTGTCAGSGTVTVKSGIWRNVYGGNYQGTYSGNASIVFEGGSLSGGSITLGNVLKDTNTATVTATVSGGTVTTIQGGTVPCASYAVTLTGGSVNKLNLNATVAPTVGGSVTVSDGTGVVTTYAPDGYEVVVDNGVYTIKEKTVVDLTPKTVYLDGTGKTEGAYTSLSAALSDMPGGGTVILSGDTSITAATALPETAEVVITSVYGDEDYRETAALKLYANLALGGDTIFRDVAIERAKQTSANIFISAGGHKLVMDTGVICLNYTGLQWISLVGGNLSEAHVGDSHITVKAGHFRNIFGGNYNGAFNGNSYVTVTGGLYDNAVCGGSYSGDFMGDAYLTFGGEASMITSGQGVIGGSLGVNGGTARTFTGDIYLTLTGSCAVNGNIFGSSRNDNITTVGDVLITVEEDAFAYYSLYGGGNTSVHQGNTKVVFNGGDIQGNIFGGAAAGTVTGNAEIIINSGKVCYYNVDSYSSGSSVAGTKNVYGGGNAGSTLSGNATVTINGGSVYGDVYGGGIDATAKVNGTSTVTVTNGTIFGKIGEADTSVIDLSNGGSVSVGVDSTADTLIGGGTLTLAAGASLTTVSVSGETTLMINGIPLPKAYITATEIAEGAAITYIAQDEEMLEENGNVYSIDFESASPNVCVTIEYDEGGTCRVRRGGAQYTEGFDRDIVDEIPTSTTSVSTTYTLTPGLYTALVKRPEGNWRYKAFYVLGNAPEQTVTVKFNVPGNNGDESKHGSLHADSITAEHYDVNSIEGYFTPKTPYFELHDGTAMFTTNAEAVEFIRELDAKTPHMYAFFPIKTTVRDFELPVVVFTKDEIPDGATIEQIAAIVGTKKGREIVGITCAVHGNEPSGAEGGLALISELCGEYGDTVFDGTTLGAIFIFPRINPEGLYRYSRTTDADVLNLNINRDYLMLSDVASATYSYVYQLFMPTMTIDVHEAYSEPHWSEGELLTDIYDTSISCYSAIGSSIVDGKASIYGDLSAVRETLGEKICADALNNLQKIGLRSYYYRKDFAPVFGQTYSANMGAFAYVLEIPGIVGANDHFARRVFTQMRTMQELINLAIATDGEIANTVEGTREALGAGAQIYDGRRPIVLDQCDSRVSNYGYTWNNPLVGADGTVRYAENIISLGANDTAMRYRSLPTAYVFPADATDVASTLALFDRHGIKYYLLDAGTTLTLQQYSGTNESATLGDAKAVTFENGAYIVPLDDYRAYVTAYLFEPDNTDAATDIIATIADAGYLAVDEIYRSTESFIAAKLRLDGTYLAVDVPAGKTVAFATVDNIVYDSVNTEGAQAFVLASDKDTYAVTLTFTDGTSETTYVGDVLGDVNGDRTVDIRDVLLALRALLNGEAIADVNGDGKVSFADIIRILKISAQ